MQEHALVAPRGGQLLRTLRPLSGAFWLDRLHAERVRLTAEAALEFCGGDAEDGCNCCCDGAILGTATFLEDVNQCTANYCYDLDGEQHSNCSALYAEVSSDGVPRFSHLGIDKEKGVDTPGVGSYDISRATPHPIRPLDRQPVSPDT